MKSFLIMVLWVSIGIGVTAVYSERNKKELPENGELVFIVMCWPAFIVADIYRALAPPAQKGE